ncbi:hypothetical protein ACFV2H_42785 [Streptomyces sp. NPDC059629]|uniref:hypothetical protein n=1 Tax=Streptomyces sp. NPDC059629 TaxID=3346889 RepID=UPI0036883E3C
MNHRKPRTSNATKSAVGLSIAATAGLALTASTTPAGASPGSSRTAHPVAISMDMAYSHADRMHVNQFDESFKIHEYGPSVAVAAHNRAIAESVGCTIDAPCRSIALSYQIVTTAGRNARLINATNVSRAVNEHCTACQTFSAAYQFVVATPRAFSLSRASRSELDTINRRADALKTSGLTISQIAHQADELAREVKEILDREAARAPRGDGGDPLADFAPTVTMYRHVR